MWDEPLLLHPYMQKRLAGTGTYITFSVYYASIRCIQWKEKWVTLQQCKKHAGGRATVVFRSFK